MKSAIRAALFGLALSVPFHPAAFAQDADTVVANVGDVAITAAELDQALGDMEQQFANFPEEQRRARALDSLIDIKVLAAQAEAQGLG